jgi:hypothetical protein
MTVVFDATRQRREALQRANQIRGVRAQLKRRVHAQTLSAAEIVVSLPSEAQSMEVREILLSQPHWGTARTDKLLNRLCLAEKKQLGTLTERQRGLLVSALDTGHERPTRCD